MKKLSFLSFTAVLLFLFTTCDKEEVTPNAVTEESLEWRGNNCIHVENDFNGCLTWVSFWAGGELHEGFGAFSTNTYTVGEYTGTWASVIKETMVSGNGATHYTLVHKFTVDEDNYFFTNDKAVCSPAIGLGGVCLINDQMTIVGGEGVFENATGKIKTHGPIMPPTADCPDGAISLHLKGKVCLD